MARFNCFAFVPPVVMTIIVLVYAALFIPLLITHSIVPPPPSLNPADGINLTTAWLDLQILTTLPHPYNSHANDDTRNWLLQRIETILTENNATFVTDSGLIPSPAQEDAEDPAVVLFNDMISNATFGSSGTTVYFEGTNIIVYIRGTEDPSGTFWGLGNQEVDSQTSGNIKGGVLVNAHYDSVSTGYGATDDGMGVITILQLLSHFTTRGNQPKKGIVLLLNNGEEDYLNGARAFLRHPISNFTHVFLNLEGAGAGGRATLFRSTDFQVTTHYKHSRHPFGTVVSGDGFRRGLVRSQTDYVVFDEFLGLRGLDVAFMEPRSRYHTAQDSTPYTSINSQWHMLSASLATVRSLTSDQSTEFDGKSGPDGKVDVSHGSDAVWFDVFGEAFAVFELHTFFAWSVTLLVATPFILWFLQFLLIRSDKWYPFASKRYRGGSASGTDDGQSLTNDQEPVHFHGLRGFFRYPIIFCVATAAVVALAYLLTKINPLIIYSSEYAVYSMMLTCWFVISWFLLRGAHWLQPTALSRFYGIFWLYIGAWIVLVLVTVGEKNLHIGGGYFMVIYFAAIFLALLLSYLEMFFFPKKQKYADQCPISSQPVSPIASRPDTSGNERRRPTSSDTRHASTDDNATETTSLLRGDRGTSYGRAYGSHRQSDEGTDGGHTVTDELPAKRPLEGEQRWSVGIPSWIWIFQFLLLAVVPVILVGQVALILTSALHQTLADGSSALTVYLSAATLTVLLLLPTLPFLHRFNWYIPTFFLFVFIGTIIYNLVAFPFSPVNQLKVFYAQQVDLDTGLNQVHLTGISPYIQQVVSQIPSAQGQDWGCAPGKPAGRPGLPTCSWSGPEPLVGARKNLPKMPSVTDYSGWLQYNVTRSNLTSTARFTILGHNTRNCRLYFTAPVSSVNISGSDLDPRMPAMSEHGSTEIRLWSRDWDRAWVVEVGWDGTGGLDGKVACEWNEDGAPDKIPALTEVRHNMPNWATVSKAGDGLVEGYKRFMV